MSKLEVLSKRLDKSMPTPTYAKGGDAGADLSTAIDFTIFLVSAN
jgi:dUTP pyrophosphatase